MKRSAVGLVVVLVGCSGLGGSDPQPQLDELKAEVAELRAQLAMEATARGSGDTGASTYTDRRVAQLATTSELAAEQARASAVETMLAGKVGAILEPRMFNAQGDNLGRWLGPALVYVEAAQGVLDLAVPGSTAVYFDGVNCSGRSYVTGPVVNGAFARVPVGTLVNTQRGTLARVTGPAASVDVLSSLDARGCQPYVGLGVQRQPVDDTIAPNVFAEVDRVRMVLVPAVR